MRDLSTVGRGASADTSAAQRWRKMGRVAPVVRQQL